jgi:hypothetical protein
VLAVASLGLVLAGCTSDGSASSDASEGSKARAVSIGGVPFLAGSTYGEGTKLRDGLEVVEGSRLLADVFPSRFAPSATPGADDRGWFATIVVTGDPREVLPAYAQQAARLDLPVPEIRCVTSTRGDGGPPVTECQGRSFAAQGVRSFQLDYERRGACCGEQPRSHLMLRYENAPDASPYPSQTHPLPDPLDTIDTRELPWGSLPVLGQGLEQGGDSNPAVAVMAGVHLVGPTGPAHANSGPGGAILRVDGDLDDVIRGYLRAGNSTDVTTTHWTDDGVRVVERHWTNGDTYTFTTYQRTGRPTWLVLQHAFGD